MDIGSRTQDIKARSFLLAGPLFISLILLAVSFKQGKTPIALPITALAGLIACYLWKWRAVAISSLALMASLALSMQSIHNHHWMWVTALALTIASTFVVTVLCVEESYREADRPADPSGDHHQAVSKLNEQLMVSQKQFASDLQEYAGHIEHLKQELNAKEDKIRSSDHLIKLVRDEMSATYTHQEKLMQDLFQARQHLAKIEARIGRDAEDIVAFLDKGIELDAIQKQLETANTEAASLKQQLEREVAGKRELTLHLEEARSEAAILAEKSNLTAVSLRESQNAHLNEVAEIQSEFEALNAKLEDVLHSNQALQDIIYQANVAESKLKDENLELRTENGRLKAGIADQHANREEAASLKAELEALKLKEKDALKVCRDLQDTLAHTREIEHNLKNTLSELQRECDHLKSEVSLRNESEVKIKQECLQLEQRLSEAELRLNSHPVETVVADERELKRIEAMYHQLKQQFNEKSEVLAETRRELFFKEEQLLALRKDFDEALIANDYETGLAVENALSQAEKERLVEEQWQQIEINHLHELIDTLNQKIVST